MDAEKMHIHNFKTEVIPSTCKENGYTLHRCECGYEHKDNFKPLGYHQYELIEEKEPTCEEKGSRLLRCAVCEEERTTDIEPIGHLWGDWKTQSFATCTEEGLQIRFCGRCGKKEEQSIKAKGHKLTMPKKSETQEGMIEYFCENCGETVVKPSASTKRKQAFVAHKKPIIAATAVVTAICVALVTWFAIFGNSDYYKAKRYIKNGDYYEAYVIFYALGDYKDSKELLKDFTVVAGETKTTYYDVNGKVDRVEKTKCEYDEDGAFTVRDENGKKLYKQELYEDGTQKFYVSYYENGEESHRREYYEDGTPKLNVGYYENGKEDYRYEYYEDGTQKLYVSYYENGKEDYRYEYYEDGTQKLYVSYYENGKENYRDENYEDGTTKFCVRYYENGKEDYRYEYNEKGDKISSRSYDEDGEEEYVIRYKYDYEYDGKSNLISKTVYKSYGSAFDFDCKYTYENEYGENGKLITRTEYVRNSEDGKDKFSCKYECQYDKKGNLIGEIIYDEDGEKTGTIGTREKFKNEYDEKGRVVYRYNYYDGRCTDTSELKYDKNGNTISVVICNLSGEETYKRKYEYDEDGNKTLEVTYSDGKEQHRTEHIYDEKGNLLSQTSYEPSSATSLMAEDFRVEYTCDENGFSTHAVVYENGVKTEETECSDHIVLYTPDKE